MVRQPDQAARLVRGADPPPTGLVVRRGQHQPVAEEVTPQPRGTFGLREPAGRDQFPHVRVCAEQHHHVAPCGAAGHHLEGGHRITPFAGGLRLGDEFAERAPPGPGGGQQHRPGEPFVAELPSPHRGGSAFGAPSLGPDGEVHPDDGRHTRPQAGLREPDRPVETSPVRDRQGVHPEPRCLLDQRARMRGAVLEGIARRHAEVGEAGSRHQSSGRVHRRRGGSRCRPPPATPHAPAGGLRRLGPPPLPGRP